MNKSLSKRYFFWTDNKKLKISVVSSHSGQTREWVSVCLCKQLSHYCCCNNKKSTLKMGKLLCIRKGKWYSPWSVKICMVYKAYFFVLNIRNSWFYIVWCDVSIYVSVTWQKWHSITSYQNFQKWISMQFVKNKSVPLCLYYTQLNLEINIPKKNYIWMMLVLLPAI